MTAAQIDIIRNSWKAVKPETKQVGFLMYDKLFAEAPFLRPMFDGDITTQACKLVAVINFVVSKLHRLSDIYPDLQYIGSRHSQYNVPAEWYDIVGSCLVASIKQESSHWEREQEECWNLLYTILKEQMLLGQNRTKNI